MSLSSLDSNDESSSSEEDEDDDDGCGRDQPQKLISMVNRQGKDHFINFSSPVVAGSAKGRSRHRLNNHQRSFGQSLAHMGDETAGAKSDCDSDRWQRQVTATGEIEATP